MAADGPPFKVDQGALAVLETLWRAGHDAYLVGGAVRDALLGLHSSDWDVATDARPERILRVFPGSSYQNRFGTVLARGLEITTFRRDHRYADHRRPDTVTFSDDVYEDLARRDFTINAIAWGRRGTDGAARLLDPADGRGDLEAGLVRAVGDPDRRFEEDALRLLRAVRIAARLDFSIESMTRTAMIAHASDIEWVSEERVGTEVRRMLSAATPSQAFRLMLDTGILVATLPEMAALAETDTSADGAFWRALETLDAAHAAEPDNERLALAALFVEIGPESARRVLDRLRVSGRDSESVCTLIAAAPRGYDAGWDDADVRRYMSQVRPDCLHDLLALRRARAAGDDDAMAREAELADRISAELAAASPLALSELAIDGADLRQTLGIPESPAVGIILKRLLADVIEEPALNTRTTLLTRASLILDELVQQGRGGADNAAIR